MPFPLKIPTFYDADVPFMGFAGHFGYMEHVTATFSHLLDGFRPQDRLVW